MPKFLHTADWQIGRTYVGLDPEVAPLLAQARLAAVQRLAELAAEQAVDAVLVAGDVFDAQTVSDKWVRRLFQALAGFTGPWIMISGNHDAALAQSVWTRAQALGCVPENVHLLLQPQVRQFEGFAVLAAPLTQRHCYDDLTAWMNDASTPPGLVRIGLAHGSVQGLLHEAVDSPNPIAPQRCAQARLDWLALGDWHGMQVLNPHMAYSGTPEADRFHNNQPGHALVVEIPAPGALPSVTPVAIGQYRWQRQAFTFVLEEDVEQAIAWLAALTAQDVVYLQLHGVLGWTQHQRLQAALAQAQAAACYVQLEQDDLRLAPSDAELANLQADGYVDTVLQQLRSESQQGDAGAQDALAVLTQALWQQQEVAV